MTLFFALQISKGAYENLDPALKLYIRHGRHCLKNFGYKNLFFCRRSFSVTFLLPSPDQNCDDDKAGDEHFNSKPIKTSNSSSHRTSSFTTTTTTRYEHRTLIKNVVGQFSPSGGRYSILNRDFSLKGSTENVAR